MAYSTISKPSLYFNTRTYNGNGGTQSITGVGFQPDMVWLKKRNGTANHHIVDAVRGVGYYIYPNLTNAEGGNGTSLITAFGTDGWTMNDGADSNASGATGVGWSWKAGTGAGSSNTDGSINTTSTSVNTTAGFSISKYTGAGSNSTVGHGLGVAPEVVWIKRLSNVDGMVVWHKSMGNDKHMKTDRNNGSSTGSNYFQDTAPSSSVVSIGSDTGVGDVGNTYVMYAFAEKKGYSKFGYYEGNGSTNGKFIYTGFKPAFIMVKRTDSANNWTMYDNKRNTSFNEITHTLIANSNDAEATSTSDDDCDFLSNGVKMRCSNNGSNGSGASYVYMAFAEEPLVANVGASIPATAR